MATIKAAVMLTIALVFFLGDHYIQAQQERQEPPITPKYKSKNNNIIK